MGTGVVAWLVFPGNRLVVNMGPGVVLTGVSATTTPGSTKRIMQIMAAIS